MVKVVFKDYKKNLVNTWFFGTQLVQPISFGKRIADEGFSCLVYDLVLHTNLVPSLGHVIQVIIL